MSRVDAPDRSFSALIVDDDPALRGLFNSLFARDGFSVDCAPNGRQAFEYLKHGAYNVILLDLRMPDVNGFELLDRLERDSPSLLRRVIVMSGDSNRVIESLDSSRVWGLIRKPFDINDLMQSAKECASGRNAAKVAEKPGN